MFLVSPDADILLLLYGSCLISLDSLSTSLLLIVCLFFLAVPTLLMQPALPVAELYVVLPFLQPAFAAPLSAP